MDTRAHLDAGPAGVEALGNEPGTGPFRGHAIGTLGVDQEAHSVSPAAPASQPLVRFTCQQVPSLSRRPDNGGHHKVPDDTTAATSEAYYLVRTHRDRGGGRAFLPAHRFQISSWCTVSMMHSRIASLASGADTASATSGRGEPKMSLWRVLGQRTAMIAMVRGWSGGDCDKSNPPGPLCRFLTYFSAPPS
jgi:hypothetical protein